MTLEEMVDLTRFIAVLCPSQKIDRATALAWYEVAGDLDYAAARSAAKKVKRRQAYVDVSDIIREGAASRAKPYERTPAEAIAESSRRELGAATTPPTPEYLAAKAKLDARMRERTAGLNGTAGS